jgi:allantoin racemase
LALARRRASVPVVGLGESGLLAAGRGGRRFAIVSLGALMHEAIRERVHFLGLADQLGEIRILPFSISEMIRNRDARRAEIAAVVRACVDEAGAEAVLLGGAPFAGVTALDGVAESVEAVGGRMKSYNGATRRSSADADSSTWSTGDRFQRGH